MQLHFSPHFLFTLSVPEMSYGITSSVFSFDFQLLYWGLNDSAFHRVQSSSSAFMARSSDLFQFRINSKTIILFRRLEESLDAGSADIKDINLLCHSHKPVHV